MSTFWAGTGLAVGPGPDGRWHYRRSLASRVILLTTMTVGLVVAFVAVAAYATTRFQMQPSLDSSLMERAHAAAGSNALLQAGIQGNVPSWQLGAADVRIAFLPAEGKGRVLDEGPDILLGQPELEVARGERDSSIRTIRIEGERYRVVTVQTEEEGLALVIAQSLEDQDIGAVPGGLDCRGGSGDPESGHDDVGLVVPAGDLRSG